MNNGTMTTCNGIIIVARYSPNTRLRPLNSMRANTYAADVAVANCRSVDAMAIPMLFAVKRQKSNASVTLVKLSPVTGSGHNVGGTLRMSASVLNAARTIQTNGPTISAAHATMTA